MTTLAYRNGILVSDSQSTINDRRAGSASKIGQIKGVLYGICGSLALGQGFIGWLRKGLPEFQAPTMSLGQGDDNAWALGYLFPWDDQIVIYTSKGFEHMKAPYFATGSGGSIALGAMAHGASAVEAVQAAMKIDIYTGGDLQIVERSRVT